MSTNQDPKDSISMSVFTNMYSVLSKASGIWPMSLDLPFPSKEAQQSSPWQVLEEEMDKRKRSKEITACPHVLRKHYAKNMCNNCYHKKGRDKNAWNCHHFDRKHYAKGCCQVCYLKNYNLTKKKLSKKMII
jgi:hypothetical protein